MSETSKKLKEIKSSAGGSRKKKKKKSDLLLQTPQLAASDGSKGKKQVPIAALRGKKKILYKK